MKEELLDTFMMEKVENTISQNIAWWENKRLIFNLLIVGFELISISIFRNGANVLGFLNIFLLIIIYTFIANVFYSIGWGLIILTEYYNLKKLTKFLNNLRIPFFILGVIFSIILTFTIFKEILYPIQIGHTINWGWF